MFSGSSGLEFRGLSREAGKTTEALILHSITICTVRVDGQQGPSGLVMRLHSRIVLAWKAVVHLVQQLRWTYLELFPKVIDKYKEKCAGLCPAKLSITILHLEDLTHPPEPYQAAPTSFSWHGLRLPHILTTRLVEDLSVLSRSNVIMR